MADIILRDATTDDSRLLWTWRNAPDVRATSFDPDEIPWERHSAWFAEKLADPDTLILIAEDRQGTPLGQIRFDVQGGEGLVNIGVAAAARGRGVGTDMIRLAVEELFRRTAVALAIAYVKTENAASLRAFEKSGFDRTSAVEVRGAPAYRLQRERPASG